MAPRKRLQGMRYSVSVQTTEYRFYKSKCCQWIACQTSIIHYSSHNPFLTNSVTITTKFNIHTTWRVAHPSRAGTTKHVYKKRQSKQCTTPGRGHSDSRAKWRSIPCKDNEQTWQDMPRQINRHGTILNQQMTDGTIKHGYINWLSLTNNLHLKTRSSICLADQK